VLFAVFFLVFFIYGWSPYFSFIVLHFCIS
jgi:hypothetical protein